MKWVAAAGGLVLSGMGCGQSEAPLEAPRAATSSQSIVTARGSWIDGKNYRFTVIAKSGADDLTEIHPAVGLNERGQVAFVGKRGSGAEHLYIGAANQSLVNLSPAYTSSRRIGSGVQISNTPTVVALDTDTSGGSFIRTWTPTAIGVNTIIAKGGTTKFDKVTAWPAINDADQVAFTAYKGASYLLATPTPGTSNYYTTAFTSVLKAPAMSGQDGDTTYSIAQVDGVPGPIRVYSETLTSLGSLMQSGEFSEVGRWPGISRDGSIVVFYGTLTATGSANHDIPNHGPGIFATYMDGGVRKVIRVAGRDVQDLSAPVSATTGNLDGVCDSGETCVPGELGFGPAGEPYSFSEFFSNSRVSIAHQSLGATGLEDDSFVVAFDASADTNHPLGEFKTGRGIWTLQVDLKRQGGVLIEKTHRPMVVIQFLDKLGDFTVGEISTDPASPSLDGAYPQVALARFNPDKSPRTQGRGDHRVAFYVKNLVGNATMVVVAERLDADEDGLPDHWEQKSTASIKHGIDFDQDGTIDLELAKLYGVKPKQKDLLVEYDFMVGSGHSHEPDSKRLAQIQTEFARRGYFLHLLKGDALPEVTPITFTRQPPRAGMTPNGSFYALKYGSPIDLCAVGNLGANADRAKANCLDERRARNLAFRYAIFGHQNATAVASGVAETGGNDFLVAPYEYDLLDPSKAQKTERAGGDPARCQPGEGPLECGYREIHASVFMHELGHSLGLLHGGGQFINCKPNYPSIMSYSLALPTLNPQRPRSFSSVEMDPLDKGALDEAVGLPKFPLLGPVGRPQDGHGRIVFGDGGGAVFESVTAVPIDWDADLNPTAGTFPQDVTFVIPVCPANQLPNLLQGHDDWANLKLAFRDHQDSNVSYAGVPLHEDFPVESHIASLAGIDTDHDGVPNLTDNCVAVANPGQADGNGNGIGDACEVSGTVDVALTVTASPSPVLVGTPVVYTFGLSQAGSRAEPEVVLTADLPEEAEYVSVTSSQGQCTHFEETLVCTLGAMAPSASASVGVTLRPRVPGSFSYEARVTTSLLETSESNNEASAEVEALCESDAQLCARLMKTCGAVSATDNCGVVRSVASCGTCSTGQSCTSSNVCE
ncbi:hypothetical protein HI113_13680 [Corallococcus exiguus]|uniref:thrombospondin type 3 repeat-containing protein n=1 Tax=Corallococcus exiguus TaxID=83462 RepID=UPI00179C04A9|nr:thrombospondin type 3 repeat-containing protein [Corallococcus exiguus]NNB94947.1 hypothetical protein [Corallococcus exiguus]